MKVRDGVTEKSSSGRVTDFIDLAVPVFNDDETLGVLGATLSADWAEEVKDTLLGSMKSSIHADVIVLNEKKQVLLVRMHIPGASLRFAEHQGRARGRRQLRRRAMAGRAIVCHRVFQE